MSLTNEKPADIGYLEDVEKHPSISEEDEELTPAEQKKVIRRVDMRLVTMTGLAYCIALMDRTNLSMAAVAG